jgi:hypothetical protein
MGTSSINGGYASKSCLSTGGYMGQDWFNQPRGHTICYYLKFDPYGAEGRPVDLVRRGVDSHGQDMKRV